MNPAITFDAAARAKKEHERLEYHYKAMLQREHKRMRSLIDDGLPTAYTSFQEYLADYFPDFSWNKPTFEVEMTILLNDIAWLTLVNELRHKRGYDMLKEVTLALVDSQGQ